MFRRSFALLVIVALLVGSDAASRLTSAQDSKSIGEKSDTNKVLLRYRLRPGTQLFYEIEHTVRTKTRMNDSEDTSEMKSTSRRHWNIREASEGNVTFENVLDAVSMIQTTGVSEITWSSDSGEEPPATFAGIREKIGKTISTVTVNEMGQEVERLKDDGTKTDLGMGSLTVAFPKDPIAIGSSWSIPREIRARDEDGNPQKIKISERYTLDHVKTGIATLAVQSQILTPIDSQAIKAQVVQQLSNGEIKFDVDNGYMIEKRLDWDENVISFRGPNSAMEYRAQMIERLVPADSVRQASKP
ncbi:MAG: DUF6263 family protein [Planctomycetota bacterium]